MKIEKIWTIVSVLLCTLFILSKYAFKDLSIDMHFGDTYYIIYAPYILMLILGVALINWMAYKLISQRHQNMARFITIAQVITFILSIAVLFWYWIEARQLNMQGRLLALALLLFAISELLLLVSIFLSKKKWMLNCNFFIHIS